MVSVDVDLCATLPSGEEYPEGSKWQRQQDGGEWEDGPELTATSWGFTSAGEWMVRAKFGEDEVGAQAVFLVDDIKIGSKIDHVLRGWNTTMGNIEPLWE